MHFLKKTATYGFLLGLGVLISWLLVISFNARGFYTLVYVPEAALLVLFGYVYLPVIISILTRPYLKRLVWPSNLPGKTIQNYNYFVILIPAHNEVRMLPKLLQSIRNQQYPSGHFMACVVADNCSDGTVAVARQYESLCLERHTDAPSNKGQALSFGWKELEANSEIPLDAIILLVDADCELEPDYLAAMNRAFLEPDSAEVLQSFRYISNYRASGVSTLDAAAEALRHWVELGSRKALRLDARIFGTGVCFRRSVLAYVLKGQQHNLVEDKAWHARLFEGNYRVDWCPAAHLATSATENEEDFNRQRKRWVGGQLSLIRQLGGRMFWQGLRRANLSQLDYTLCLMQLPRSFMLALAGLFGMIAFVFPDASFLPWWGWGLLGAFFIVYAAYGLFLIRAEPQLYLRLLFAPLLVLRVFLITFQWLSGHGITNWEAMRDGEVRTATEQLSVAANPEKPS
ncbi:MAG TPA: glycosyltransferase family 2 protein [Chloroflexia bacterium]|nr:glycosyltransferase family 2 protein [Chloroflexia bacterium]